MEENTSASAKTTVSQPPPKRLTLRAGPHRWPRPKNYLTSEAVLDVAPKGQVEFVAPDDSRMILVFLDTERVDGADRHAPFGIKTLDLPAGESRTLRADFGAEGEEYRYAVYLVDHDDLADGHSTPRIKVVSF